ncbi:microtubule-associated protein 70-5 [Tanacetum coccineum]
MWPTNIVEKDHELGFAHSEIKVLKATDVSKDKSLDEMANMAAKLDEKLRTTENLLEQKKEAFAAQFAAEATLRRVHTNQKDDNMVPIESIITPLEADIRMYNNEIAALQEDKKTLERHTKLRDKLTMSERTSKSEAQLKVKVKLRLKTLEDCLKQSTCGSPKLDKSNQFFGSLSSHGGRKRSTSQPRGSFESSQKSDVDSKTRKTNSINKKYASGENFLRKSLWASRSKVADGDEKESNERLAVKNDNIRESDVLQMMMWFPGFCMIASERSDWFKEVLRDERKQLECKRR